MKYDSQIHHRRSIRITNYDYAGMGSYFVTICTYNKESLFGDIINMKIRLNDLGKVVEECWRAIPIHFEMVELDTFVVMPNHVHGIIMITDTTTLVGATHASPLSSTTRTNICQSPLDIDSDSRWATHASPLRSSCSTHPKGPNSQSLGAIIGSFKSEVSKWYHKINTTPSQTVWQRNYYEHIIRNDTEWDQIRQYIKSNPARWNEDRENPNTIMK